MSFQSAAFGWLVKCFGQGIAFDKTERGHRFIEEALELVQSIGCTAEECHQVVDYVYGRPTGKPFQEIGGTMVCLAALCNIIGEDMEGAGWEELCRCWEKIERIRAKNLAKPKFSPLPGVLP